MWRVIFLITVYIKSGRKQSGGVEMALHNISKDCNPGVVAGKMNMHRAGDLKSQKIEDAQNIMKNERSRWDIILEMLRATQEENDAKKTHIMHEDSRIFDRYLNFLQNEHFIINYGPENNYHLTKKGRELLEGLNKINVILGVNEKIITRSKLRNL